MAQSFPKIEDIVEGLSTDLDQRGFSRVDSKGNEAARYEKRDNPAGFQVGIEQYDREPWEPGFNMIDLILSYDLPEGVSPSVGENTIPRPELMNDFFRNSPIYHRGCIYNEDISQDGKMKLVYFIGFEKDKTTAVEMRAVLRETIDYFCNHITTNVQMLTRTQSFGE